MNRLAALPLLALLLCSLGILAEKPDTPPDELARLNRQIAEVNGKIEACKQQRMTLFNQIYRLELQAESAIVQQNRTQLLHQETRQQIASMNGEKKQLTESIASSREQMRRVLRVLYKAGGEGTLRALLNVRDFQQLFTNYHLISRLLDSDFDQIRQLKREMARLAQLTGELLARESRLTGLQKEQQRQIAELRQARSAKLLLIERVNRDRQSFLQWLDELQEQAGQLDRIVHQRTTPSTGGDLAAARGRLPWPLRGEIVTEFGRKKSSRFNTYVLHNGIEIRPASERAEVKAVWGGEIIYADYLQGYGNLLIVQHGRNYHTLYGRLESFLKQKGDKVGRGEEIAIAGSSGATDERVLYFEIRTNLKSEDPLKWLGKR